MARARILKMGFFENEVLAQLPDKARLLYAGLWLIADRSGRLEDRPMRIRAQIFPYEAVDCEALLVNLATAGFIRRYESEGVKVIDLPSFAVHQSPHHREPDSKLPAFSQSLGYAEAKPNLAPVEPQPSPADPVLDPVRDLDPVPDPVRDQGEPLPLPLAHRSYGQRGNRHTNLLDNNLDHGECGYAPSCTVGVCVKRDQHREFTLRLAVSDGIGPDARSLQDFYADTVAEWRAAKKVPGGSCWQAWSTRFEAWLGAEAKPAQRGGKETISERAIRSHTEFVATLPKDRPERPAAIPPRPTRQIASGE